MEERPQKPDLIFRSSIDTSTPRLQTNHRRQPSFSSPTYSPAVSPSYSDHSTSRGFYSPRGGEEDDDGEADEDEYSNGDEVEEDERGYLYRPRSPPAVEMPVISTVSRSVRVEPKVVTRVDSGVKEREFVERRVVEEEFNGGGTGRGSVRRKWKGRSTVVYDSGVKEREGIIGLRFVEEESSEELRGRKMFEFGAKEKEVVEEESVEFGGRRGRKSNAFVADSCVKEKVEVAGGKSVVEEANVELGDQKSNAFVSEFGVKEKCARGQRLVEEGNLEFRDGRGQKSNAFASDSSVKDMEVARGQRIFKEGRGVSVKLEARNAMILDSSPKLVYDSRSNEEVGRTKTVMYETGRKEEEEEFDRAGGVEEGGGRGGEDVEGLKPSFRQRREGRKSEMLFMRKAALCLRIVGLAMCVISFSIMATNKNNGWALDSYDRYKEFRSAPTCTFSFGIYK